MTIRTFSFNTLVTRDGSYRLKLKIDKTSCHSAGLTCLIRNDASPSLFILSLTLNRNQGQNVLCSTTTLSTLNHLLYSSRMQFSAGDRNHKRKDSWLRLVTHCEQFNNKCAMCYVRCNIATIFCSIFKIKTQRWQRLSE